MAIITIFKEVTDVKQPFYITVEQALERIKSGKNKDKIDLIRAEPDAEKRSALKAKLPCVLFSGKFSNRLDKGLIVHSGMCILDFDHTPDVEKTKKEVFAEDFIYATWRSPSGDGCKALAIIKNPDKHRQHYASLLKCFKEKGINSDEKNINVSRVCYESYDPDIFIKTEEAKPYEGIEEQKAYVNVNTTKPTQRTVDDSKIYANIKKWAEKRGEFFIEGNRNNFIAKMAAACNRFGINDYNTISFLSGDFLHDGNFSSKELERTVKSIYRNYQTQHATAHFEDREIINPGKKEEQVFDVDMKIKDLVYFSDCWDNMKYRIKHGSPHGESTYFPILDNHFRFMRREVTGINGFGNVGKTAFELQLCLIQSVFKRRKWAVFSPENFPADYFYQDLAEMYVGKPFHTNAPIHATDEEIETAIKFVNEHFFYIYPKDDSPTLDYVLKTFVETIIKHKIDGVIIDPWNQLVHNRETGHDLYLEQALSKTKRFAQNQDIFFHIVMHPSKQERSGNKKYDEPDENSPAGGPMWWQKLDNLLCYHRPNFFIDKQDPWCTFASQKIKKQKLNGLPGRVNYIYNRETMRFMEIDGEPEFGTVGGKNPLNTINATEVQYEPTAKPQPEDDEMPF